MDAVPHDNSPVMSAVAPELAAALAGHYRLERELGRGGMATVYLAEDLKHNRRVAIKVLRPDLSAALGPERFAREIAVTARLQHSHILPLFDSGEANGLLYYVMPYVDGETLRQRMERENQLAIDATIQIIADVASALSYAHGHGIIHRDVKPENILLRDGGALVADFGIAAPLDDATRDRLTQTGVALGTPRYMSPEQAAGDRTLDARSDVYSLAAVAYEMLTGAPPHVGPTNQAVVARLLTEAATPVSVLRPGVPRSVERAVGRALSKAPADRYETAEEFARTLSAPDAGNGTPAPVRSRRTLLGLGVGATVLFVIVAALLARSTLGASTSALHPGRVTHLTRDPGLELDPALSPDGKSIAYAAGAPGDMRVFVRQLAGGEAIEIAKATNENQRWPQWSPDGTRIAFQVGRAERAIDPATPPNALYVVPSLGGAARRLVADSLSDITPAWSPDGKRIAFGRGSGVNARAIYVTDVDGEAPPSKIVDAIDITSPRWSPDASMIAYVGFNPRFSIGTSHLGNDAPTTIFIVTLADHKTHRITSGTSLDVSPVWTPDGRSLLFVSNRGGSRDVYHVAIERSGDASGAPVRITSGLNAHGIDLSRDGRTLAYSAYSPYSHIWSAPIPTSGATTFASATQITNGDEVIEGIALSTNGQWLAYDSDRSGNGDVWKIPVTGGQAIQLTTDPSGDYVQDWSGDDSLISFHSYRTGKPQIYVMNADGTGTMQVGTDSLTAVGPEFSPDGNALAYERTVKGHKHIVIVSRDGRKAPWSAPRELVVDGTDPAWSPDGKLIAFISGGVRVVSPTGAGNRMVISSAASDGEPLFAAWSKDSKTLYYKAYDADGHSSIWSVPVAGGKPRLLIRFNDELRPSTRREFATDDKRLYFTIAQQESDIWLMELTSK